MHQIILKYMKFTQEKVIKFNRRMRHILLVLRIITHQDIWPASTLRSTQYRIA